MFPTRYFPDRYFAPRYFPKVGSDVVQMDGVIHYRLPLEPLSYQLGVESLTYQLPPILEPAIPIEL